MIILDRLLVGGLRFVLDKVIQAVDAEMDDEDAFREELLAAQMRLDLGEIGPDEFARLEADLLGRIRAIREARTGPAGPVAGVDGVEVSVTLGHDRDG